MSKCVKWSRPPSPGGRGWVSKLRNELLSSRKLRNEYPMGGGGLKMVPVARGLAKGLRGSIGTRIPEGKVFKT